MPIRHGRILLIGLSLIAVFLYWQRIDTIYENKGRLIVTQEDGSVRLTWNDEVGVPMALRFEEAFAEWRNQTSKFIIDLNSPGGSLREGAAVIALINDMKRTHDIETHVGRYRACLSMCVPIYLQGDTRRASANSRWMFHEPSFMDLEGETAQVPEIERQYFAERFFEKYFVNSPMNETWRENLRQVWVGQDVWYSGAQLYAENSNIIQEVY